MTRLLMVVTGARAIRLADGEYHPCGYQAAKVRKPYEEFAAPGGRTPQPDPWGLEPFFHCPDADEDFMFSVLRRFAYHPDRGRVTFLHFSELNLVALRRVYLALRGAGMEVALARRTVESAAQRSWRCSTDLIEVLMADDEVASRLTAVGIVEIGNDVVAAGRAEARHTVEVLSALPGLRSPHSLNGLTDREILSFDAVYFPGGRGVLVDLADDPDVGRILRLAHGGGTIVAALCHGPAALLSAPDVAGKWTFDGYRMTAFSDTEDDLTRRRLPWSLEAELKNRGAIFDDGDAAWLSHVVIDRNLVTGQNSGSSEAVACAALRLLEA